MKMSRCFNHRFFLLVLAAGFLGRPDAARAKNIGPSPLKVYRNDTYGFEFRYPGEFEVVASSAADDPAMESSGTDGIVIRLVYHPDIVSHVWAGVLVQRGLTEESCNFPTDSSRQDMKLNGFYKTENTDDADADEVYRNYHKGNCFRIKCGKDHVHSDDKKWADEMNNEAGMHYERLKEVVESFRFLDRAPKGHP
jgi:hypothetical protein